MLWKRSVVGNPRPRSESHLAQNKHLHSFLSLRNVYTYYLLHNPCIKRNTEATWKAESDLDMFCEVTDICPKEHTGSAHQLMMQSLFTEVGTMRRTSPWIKR